MKFLILLMSVLLLSLSSFARLSEPKLFKNMEQAEAFAENLASLQHGEYFFGEKEARMLIYADAAVVHAVQVRHQGKIQHFAIASDADKEALRELLKNGAVANDLVTRLAQIVEIDGVIFKLLALVPMDSEVTALDWRAAQYSNSLPGLPGLRAKYNRTVTLSSDARTGKLVKGQIYQVSLSGLFKPETLPLVLQ